MAGVMVGERVTHTAHVQPFLRPVEYTLTKLNRIYALSSHLRRNHDVKNVEGFLPEDNIPYRQSDYAREKSHR